MISTPWFHWAASVLSRTKGRWLKFAKVVEPILSVKSRAAPIVDTWSHPDKPFNSPGGGIQYLIHKDEVRNIKRIESKEELELLVKNVDVDILWEMTKFPWVEPKFPSEN